MVMRASNTTYRVVSEEKGTKMAYRYFGQTGLTVSILGYGNWKTGEGSAEDNQQLVTDSVKKCFDAGINFFDTAEIYELGAAEL